MIASGNGSTGTGSLSPPLELGVDYLLFVAHPGDTAGAHDFYFINHMGSGSNPVEAEDQANNTAEGAEALELVNQDDGSVSFFVDGNIVDAPTDVDHFLFTIPTTVTSPTINVACAGDSAGSGLRDLKFSIADLTGTALAGAEQTASEDGKSQIKNVMVPAETSSLLLKLEAGSQAAAVSSDFYRCGIHISSSNP